MMEILVCNHLSKSYGSLRALDDIDLTLNEGKIVGLLGPNGSGKTTLIKLISRLLVPSEGEIEICGIEPSAESKALISRARRTAYFVFPEAVGPRTQIRSISPERYFSRISDTFISSAGGSSAIGGMGVKGFFAIAVQI